MVERPDFVFADFTPPVVSPVSLPSSLVRTRPDILAAEADLHADTARIGVATANLYPDIQARRPPSHKAPSRPGRF